MPLLLIASVTLVDESDGERIKDEAMVAAYPDNVFKPDDALFEKIATHAHQAVEQIQARLAFKVKEQADAQPKEHIDGLALLLLMVATGMEPPKGQTSTESLDQAERVNPGEFKFREMALAALEYINTRSSCH